MTTYLEEAQLELCSHLALLELASFLALLVLAMNGSLSWHTVVFFINYFADDVKSDLFFYI